MDQSLPDFITLGGIDVSGKAIPSWIWDEPRMSREGFSFGKLPKTWNSMTWSALYGKPSQGPFHDCGISGERRCLVQICDSPNIPILGEAPAAPGPAPGSPPWVVPGSRSGGGSREAFPEAQDPSQGCFST